MFDEGTKIAVFVVVVAAALITMASDHYAPRAELTTVVDSADLPPLPPIASWNGAPTQSKVTEMHVALGDGFSARLMYGYVLEGLVVTRREFRHDTTSAISPLDLGIVWGELSAPGAVDGLAFKAGHRIVWVAPSADAKLPDKWLEQVTNNHLVPASQAVSAELLAIEVGARVRISGYLIEVTREGILPWRSSTRRDDSTGVGGCEIILVRGVDVLPVNEKAA
ncbi:hypothetical protein GCM10007385_18800 [Tateyamaria omphalii]|uniref:hypothetical protein n=1 Tax=Tateyamaria omphalii TaxID=299262 RepID=UPI00167A9231|nr:hypothetical protein [Tateyamaria omphalii]GGX50537.1 hypothetical protein GCM10007385_18800 [Tateyamaria omphalii]